MVYLHYYTNKLCTIIIIKMVYKNIKIFSLRHERVLVSKLFIKNNSLNQNFWKKKFTSTEKITNVF